MALRTLGSMSRSLEPLDQIICCIQVGRRCGVCRLPMTSHAPSSPAPIRFEAPVRVAAFQPATGQVFLSEVLDECLDDQVLKFSDIAWRFEKTGILIHECVTWNQDCRHDYRSMPGVWLHPSCAEMTSCLTPTFFRATQYRSTPSVAEEWRRLHTARDALANALKQMKGWPCGLPHEIWLAIAEEALLDEKDHPAKALCLGWPD